MGMCFIGIIVMPCLRKALEFEGREAEKDMGKASELRMHGFGYELD